VLAALDSTLTGEICKSRTVANFVKRHAKRMFHTQLAGMLMI